MKYIQSEGFLRQHGEGELALGMSAVEEGQLGAFSASLIQQAFTPATGSMSSLVKLNK